jgi:hypothetical protein
MGVRGSGGTVRPAGPPYPGGHPDVPPGLGEWPAGDCGGGGPSQARAFLRPADLGRSAQRAAIRRAAALADGWIAGEPDAGTYPGAGAVAGRRDTQAGTAAARVPRGGLLARVHLGRGWACLGDGAAVSSLRAVEIPGCRTGEGAPRAASVAPGSRRAIGGPLRAEIICGAPAEVAARVAELADIARVAGPRFTFIARMHYPGMDPAIVRAAARLFAEEVIPAVRARVPGSD